MARASPAATPAVALAGRSGATVFVLMLLAELGLGIILTLPRVPFWLPEQLHLLAAAGILLAVGSGAFMIADNGTEFRVLFLIVSVFAFALLYFTLTKDARVFLIILLCTAISAGAFARASGGNADDGAPRPSVFVLYVLILGAASGGVMEYARLVHMTLPPLKFDDVALGLVYHPEVLAFSLVGAYLVMASIVAAARQGIPRLTPFEARHFSRASGTGWLASIWNRLVPSADWFRKWLRMIIEVLWKLICISCIYLFRVGQGLGTRVVTLFTDVFLWQQLARSLITLVLLFGVVLLTPVIAGSVFLYLRADTGLTAMVAGAAVRRQFAAGAAWLVVVVLGSAVLGGIWRVNDLITKAAMSGAVLGVGMVVASIALFCLSYVPGLHLAGFRPMGCCAKMGLTVVLGGLAFAGIKTLVRWRAKDAEQETTR
jgi:hypothetical protein